MDTENNVSSEATKTKLPLILRWPLIVICLFLFYPFGMIAALCLTIARLVFSHKHPEYKLKLFTKIVAAALCCAFIVWGAQQPSDESSTPDESTTADSVVTESINAISKDQEIAFKKIEKALDKKTPEKQAKALSKIDETYVYDYLAQQVPEQINGQNIDQIAERLSLYLSAFPEGTYSPKITALQELCTQIQSLQKQLDSLDKKYSDEGGLTKVAQQAESAEQRAFYVRYKLESSASKSDNDLISAIGKVADAVSDSSGTYSYYANNVENNFVLGLAMGIWDTDVYPGDEVYVIKTGTPFSQAGATNLYVYQDGTTTLKDNQGFENTVPVYCVIDSDTVVNAQTDIYSYQQTEAEIGNKYSELAQGLIIKSLSKFTPTTTVTSEDFASMQDRLDQESTFAAYTTVGNQILTRSNWRDYEQALLDTIVDRMQAGMNKIGSPIGKNATAQDMYQISQSELESWAKYYYDARVEGSQPVAGIYQDGTYTACSGQGAIRNEIVINQLYDWGDNRYYAQFLHYNDIDYSDNGNGYAVLYYAGDHWQIWELGWHTDAIPVENLFAYQ